MAIQIPSNLPLNTAVDFHHNDLVTPPSAPSVVENVQAIDPRVALKLTLPVGQAPNNASLQDVVNAEPSADKAVLLELASQQTQASNVVAEKAQTLGGQGQLQSMLANSLSKMDQLGGAALGQLLSDILLTDTPELGVKVNDPLNQVQPSGVGSATVNWPTQSAMVSADPRVFMNNLYQSLQASGIFSADNLRKLLMPSPYDEQDSRTPVSNEKSEDLVNQYLSNLSKDSPGLSDSVKLLLRGDLLWQGQILPNVSGSLYREDAWQNDESHNGQLVKGSRLTMEINLPNLGPLKIVGTQFGEQVSLMIAAQNQSQEILKNAFQELLVQLKEQIDDEPQVQIMGQDHGS